MVNDAGMRYLPLIDGKPPLFMWGTSFVMKVLPNLDPLLTGRLMAGISGFMGLAGILFTSWVLFKNRRVSLISAMLYIFVPFTFFYDRFGLADSMLAMWGIWSLGLSVLLVRSLRLDVAMILGIVIGLGFLTKSPALFFLLFTPLPLIFIKRTKKNFLKYIGLFLIVVVLSQAIYSILRLFPLFNMIGQKNLEFAVPFSDLLRHPFMYFWGNLKSLLTWEFFYLTPLVSILVVWSIVRAMIKKSFSELIITVCFILFTFAMAAANKVIYPRFLLIFTPALLILAALALNSITKRFFVLILGLVLLLPIYTDLVLITKPSEAPIPEADSGQYMNGWAAGYGVKEVRQFLSLHPNSTVITEGTFGLMPYSLDLYQKEYPTVIVKSFWPLPKMADINLEDKTYLVVYQHNSAPEGWSVTQISEYRQGKSDSFLKLYEVISSKK